MPFLACLQIRTLPDGERRNRKGHQTAVDIPVRSDGCLLVGYFVLSVPFCPKNGAGQELHPTRKLIFCTMALPTASWSRSKISCRR